MLLKLCLNGGFLPPPTRPTPVPPIPSLCCPNIRKNSKDVTKFNYQ